MADSFPLTYLYCTVLYVHKWNYYYLSVHAVCMGSVAKKPQNLCTYISSVAKLCMCIMYSNLPYNNIIYIGQEQYNYYYNEAFDVGNIKC